MNLDRFSHAMPWEDDAPTPICPVCFEWAVWCTCDIEIEEEDEDEKHDCSTCKHEMKSNVCRSCLSGVIEYVSWQPKGDAGDG